VAREGQSARFAINAENRDVVGSLVAAVKEVACRIEIETARIIATRPFVGNECQFAVFLDPEYPDAVMETITRIDEPAIGGNQNLGAKITAGEPGRQARDGLSRR